MKRIGSRQLRILSNVLTTCGWAQSWLSYSEAERQKLVNAGLMTNPDAPRHHITTQYQLTNLGEQVVCANFFARGLDIGWQKYALDVAYRLEAEARREAEDALEARTARMAFDTLEQTYSADDRLDKAVRSVLWKNVKVEP